MKDVESPRCSGQGASHVHIDLAPMETSAVSSLHKTNANAASHIMSSDPQGMVGHIERRHAELGTYNNTNF
jgi:hypothetical protein